MSADASTEDVDLTGYARFADLLCEPRYQNFRSFKYLRVRMLLRQQRILDHLETQLRSLDNFDARFHNTWTHDPDKDLNEEREALFVRLGVELQVFDELLQNNKAILKADQPYNKRVEEIRNFAAHCINPVQVRYLDMPDLVYTGGDGKFDQLHRYSDAIVQKIFQFREQIDRARHVYDYDRHTHMRDAISSKIARGIAAFLSILVLLLPMIILNFVETSGWKLAIVSIFAAVFISALTILSAAGTLEIFVAGATYCAVLVVFVSQGGASGSG
ncbi:hypothetical protein HDK64DRAFT_333677 [Phyllosticta capitalensis]